MSRWFPERLPGRLAAVIAFVRGVRNRCAPMFSGEHIMLRLGDAPAIPDLPALAAGAPGGQARRDAMLDAFARELDARALPRGSRLSCVLAGESVRYGVVPWRDELSSPAQRQVLAEHCFHEIHGAAAQAWTVRQTGPRYGAATLACAVDTLLLDRLDALARERGLVLASVQPALVQAFNQARRAIARGRCWFVVRDGAWITLLLMSDTEPLHVKQLLSPGADLACLLDREWFALGFDDPACPVYVVGVAAATPHAAAAARWPIVELPVPGSDVSPLEAQPVGDRLRTA